MSTAACGESCGWMAAALSALAFGTFGVPIKSEAARSVDIDPLVFQSYKTFLCFATSWLILWAGEDFTFSPWGIVSGLFWVPGGVATIYAIKAAGLAIGIGIGSSFIVLVSFTWGIFVFDEQVYSRVGACTAILCMMAGLFGMSYYSSPQQQQQPVGGDGLRRTTTIRRDTEDGSAYHSLGDDSVHGDEEEESNTAASLPESPSTGNCCSDNHTAAATEPTIDTASNSVALSDDDENGLRRPASTIASDDDDELLHGLTHAAADPTATTSILVGAVPRNNHTTDDNNDDAVVMVDVRGYKIAKRKVGMLAAAFCGIWGGSIMAPMKFCKSDTKGTHYLMSFSIGASIVTVCFWIIRYLYNVVHYQSFGRAYESLPSFHVRVMWLAGGTSGLLWSIGNFFSLISVFYLGEGVGYPLVQTSILVSGLWGIFYFKEVQGRDQISKWLASSLLTVFGILLLSYEHHEKEAK